MKRIMLITFLLLLCLACNSKEAEVYTFDKLKDEFKETFAIYEIPIGTYFWDEFNGIEAQYELMKNESKLLGEWINVIFTDLVYNYYSFFPNKFFLLTFNIEKCLIITLKKLLFLRINFNEIKITI
jgi:hypothetical protein